AASGDVVPVFGRSTSWNVAVARIAGGLSAAASASVFVVQSMRVQLTTALGLNSVLIGTAPIAVSESAEFGIGEFGIGEFGIGLFGIGAPAGVTSWICPTVTAPSEANVPSVSRPATSSPSTVVWLTSTKVGQLLSCAHQ